MNRVPHKLNLIGNKFGRLTVTEKIDNGKLGKIKWLCLCDCGNNTTVNGGDLTAGKTTSCGCYSKEVHCSHNLSKTNLYIVWTNMKQRCYNENSPEYKNYGERGIIVCDEWIDFINFYNDMSQSYISGLSLDRIDNNGNYTFDNCRWADKKTQSNNRRVTKKLNYNNQDIAMSDLCRQYNIEYELLKSRLKQGWTIEKAIETPKKGGNRL